LGARKQALLAAGATVDDMAIAMLETDHMEANYKYGDGKSGDSANFGIFKQNWLMIRSVESQFKSLGANDFHKGEVLNKDLHLDIQTLHNSQKHYGMDVWFGGHRNGETGLKNHNTADINDYKNGVLWIRDQINKDPKHKTDDIRFWVDVTPI
jgi:hypothetical protein